MKSPARTMPDQARSGAAPEWLVTNGLGGYASGTVAGFATRRYHGLLIAALPSPLGRTMMLNHCVERLGLPDGSAATLGVEHRAVRPSRARAPGTWPSSGSRPACPSGGTRSAAWRWRSGSSCRTSRTRPG